MVDDIAFREMEYQDAEDAEKQLNDALKNKKIYASDYECVECGEQAEVFWPVIDPDIKSHPFCKNCAREAQFRVFLALEEKPGP